MYTFELTQEEANLVLKALGELPAKISYDLITKLQLQATKKESPKEEKQK